VTRSARVLLLGPYLLLLAVFFAAPIALLLAISVSRQVLYSFDPTAAAVSAFAIGVALVLVLGIARFLGLEEFTGF
jgi:ABC-type sugar transport system permease subunit